MKPGLRSTTAAIMAVMFVVGIFVGQAPAANWWESVKIKGDFRFRHEMIDSEGDSTRNRQRIRARVGLFGEVSPYTKVGIQLATGSDDPVSTNQTLDDAASTKSIGLDLAYFEARHDRLPGLSVVGGKFKNPFFKPGKSELIWDSDLNPEGGALRYQSKSDVATFVITGSGWWIDERSSADDSYLAAGQALGKFKFNENKSSLTIGGGFYNYVNARGFEPFFDSEDAFGNSTVKVAKGNDSVLNYANDFELVEFFVEASHKFEKIPVTLFGDYVTNTAADSLETGWLVGLRVGKIKKSGSWQFRYNYRKVERDAVLGVFTDSDFRGGGTDAKGHEFGGAVQLARNTALGLSYFANQFGLEETKTGDFNRLQIDLQLKF